MDINYLSAIIFYSIILILIFVYRKKFIIQSHIIALYKTKLGLNLMDRIAAKFPRLLRFLGYLGIFIGFIGMAFILYTITAGAFDLLTNPSASPTVAPIIPGVKIPGSPIYVPFWYGIISLFIIIVIHEFSHGVISRVHKVNVDSSGVGMFLFFPLAFVEPNEAQLQKLSKKQQLSIYAAGPFSNILTAVLIIFIALFLTFPAQNSMVSYNGVYFKEIVASEPAHLAGVQPNTVYTMLNNKTISDIVDFTEELNKINAGETVILSNSELSHIIRTGKSPLNESRAYLGVKGISSSYTVKETTPKWQFYLIDVFNSLLNWLFILSIGIGLANLLPLGPVDGGKMIYTAFNGMTKKDYASAVFKYLTLFVALLLLFNLIFPYLRSLF